MTTRTRPCNCCGKSFATKQSLFVHEKNMSSTGKRVVTLGESTPSKKPKPAEEIAAENAIMTMAKRVGTNPSFLDEADITDELKVNGLDGVNRDVVKKILINIGCDAKNSMDNYFQSVDDFRFRSYF